MEHALSRHVSDVITAKKAPWAALVVVVAGVRHSVRFCLEAADARVAGVATGDAASRSSAIRQST